METEIQNDIKTALKAGEKLAVSTLRMVLASLKNRRIEKGEDLDEKEFLEIVKREVKTRKDAASQYKETRPELAEKEEAEIEILLKYLPAQLSDEEVVAIAREVIEQTGATGPGDLGKIMGPLMGRLQGRADGNRAREAIQAVFAE